MSPATTLLQFCHSCGGQRHALSASYFKGRHKSAFLPQNSEIVEAHSVGTGMQPGRMEELTSPQGQPSPVAGGNWRLNALLWRDKLNMHSEWLLGGVEPCCPVLAFLLFLPHFSCSFTLLSGVLFHISQLHSNFFVSSAFR